MRSGAFPWIFVDSVSDIVPDAYWSASKFVARVSLIREAFDFFCEVKIQLTKPSMCP